MKDGEGASTDHVQYHGALGCTPDSHEDHADEAHTDQVYADEVYADEPRSDEEDEIGARSQSSEEDAHCRHVAAAPPYQPSTERIPLSEEPSYQESRRSTAHQLGSLTREQLRAIQTFAHRDRGHALGTLVRHLSASKWRLRLARARLRKLDARIDTWRWRDLEPTRHLQLLDTIGYWQLAGGPDAEGRPVAFIEQRAATRPSSYLEAAAGMRAAHAFFTAAAVPDQPLVVVAFLGGVPVRRLLYPHRHLRAVGDGYSRLLPIRLARLYVVDAYPLVARTLRLLARRLLSSKMSARLVFCTSAELEHHVPRTSWPCARGGRGPPLGRTSAIVAARLAAHAAAAEELRPALDDIGLPEPSSGSSSESETEDGARAECAGDDAAWPDEVCYDEDIPSNVACALC